VKALEAENEALRLEVARLKQLLSEANGAPAIAASAAERMKRMRAKKKAGK
jgi:regulator of replication initiation timing